MEPSLKVVTDSMPSLRSSDIVSSPNDNRKIFQVNILPN